MIKYADTTIPEFELVTILPRQLLSKGTCADARTTICHTIGMQNYYMCTTTNSHIICIPVQPDPLSLPSPVKLVGQVQVKLPSPLTHMAPVTQSERHSLTSGLDNVQCYYSNNPLV